jgi:hypothetical protein
MSNHYPAGLSPADIAILYEVRCTPCSTIPPDMSSPSLKPNPYSYDSTVTDPSLPPSSFVQVMREQEEIFFGTFPEAKKAAQLPERRKQQIHMFLASRDTPTLFDCQLDYVSPLVAVPGSPIPVSHSPC